MDPDIPLLISHRLGPGDKSRRGVCIPSAEAKPGHWSCCSDADGPCRVFLDDNGNVKPSEMIPLNGNGTFYDFDRNYGGNGTFVPMDGYCEDRFSNECCRSEPWDEGKYFGYPYRVRIVWLLDPYIYISVVQFKLFAF